MLFWLFWQLEKGPKKVDNCPENYVQYVTMTQKNFKYKCSTEKLLTAGMRFITQFHVSTYFQKKNPQKIVKHPKNDDDVKRMGGQLGSLQETPKIVAYKLWCEGVH